nr:hypothetical protein [uncultured Desulfobacter sp.]
MKENEYKGLTPQKTADELMGMYYLEARSYLLETAAILDRIERAAGGDTAMDDPRIERLFSLCRMLTEQKKNRAETFLNMLSD